ncbi:hypothetical protein JTB14_026790 [Gonioctena quinquepunctata]|nr:hypothetical protein JTB14_026790 [Gonioctena quinquepunctata]
MQKEEMRGKYHEESYFKTEKWNGYDCCCFNECLHGRKIPNDWKMAHITSISRQDTNMIAKIIEKFMCSKRTSEDPHSIRVPTVTPHPQRSTYLSVPPSSESEIKNYNNITKDIWILFEDSSDEEDSLEEMDFEPDVIDGAAVEPQVNHCDVADLSLLPACTSKDDYTTFYKVD